MGIFNRRKTLQPVTAATVIDGGNPASPKSIDARQQDWQNRVIALSNIIPEVAAAGSYIHNSLDRVRYKTMVPDNESIPESVLTLLDRGLEDFRSGRAGHNIFFIGEVIIGYKLSDDQREFTWETFSKHEIKIVGDDVHVQRKGKFVADPDLQLFSVRTPDPIDASKAFSPHKAQIEVLEAWSHYQALDNRLAQNRLALSGMLILPGDELDDIPGTPDGLPAPGSRQEWMQNFVNAVQMNLRAPDPTKAAVPYVSFFSKEGSDAAKHMTINRVDDAKAYNERVDGYAQRYARGVDLPVEIVMGMGDANHWTAWKIDDDTWKDYLAPKAGQIATSLTQNYAQVIAEKLLGRPVDIEVVADPVDLVTKPDQTQTAIELFKVGAITKQALIDKAGFDPEDIDPLGTPIQSQQQQPGADASRQAPVQGAAGDPVADQLRRISEGIVSINHALNKKLSSVIDKNGRRILRTLKQERKESEGDFAAIRAQGFDLEAANAKFRIEIQDAIAKAVTGRAVLIAKETGRSTTEAAESVLGTAEARGALAGDVAVREASLAAERAVQRDVPYRSNPSLANQIISISHGGPDAIDPDTAGATQRVFTAGDDPQVTADLNTAGITYTTKTTWMHGSPENPYEPHEALDGTEWESGDPEAERSAIGGGDDPSPFSNTGVYYPGDHKGCTCEFVTTFEEVKA